MSTSGGPSDDLPEVLALGRTTVTHLVASLSGRDPGGQDARYLEWHALDHRPEQHRLPGLRGSFRVVSTPDCRAARAMSKGSYEAVDHVVVYLFTAAADLVGFRELGGALRRAGRMPVRLPSVEVGVYTLTGTVAAPRVLAGADVLPWRPARGAYLVIERGGAPGDGLASVPGVAGVWWSTGTDGQPFGPLDRTGLQLTVCFLDDDPVEVAGRLGAVLDARWATTDVEPLLAAPFHTVVPFAWDRHLP
jgi:hypothetical protein